jgi:hypothetical protein
VGSVAATDVTNLVAFDPAATWFQWDPVPGGGALYDLVRGVVANLSSGEGAVDLGPLTCLVDDSPGESTQAHPDTQMPAPDTAFFYLVRFQKGSVIGPWGFGSAGQGRSGTGGCSP